MFSFKDMVKEISRASGLAEHEVNEKIEDKLLELSGLVSPEGAAYIVGKELGVNLVKDVPSRRLKIKNVTVGMRSVDVTGRVVRISNRRDFERDGKTRGVVNVMLGDETGMLRLPLWDSEIDWISELDVNSGDVISIRNGYIKENGRGEIEIRLGRFGRMAKSDEEMPEISEMKDSFDSLKAKNISELKEGEYCEVRASLVQVFERAPFYDVCPKCEARLENDGNVRKCKDHGQVEPKRNLVVSGVLDDGTGNIRVVFFRELAEKVIGDAAKDLKNAKDGKLTEIYENIQLGGEFMIKGRVKKNQFSEKLELVANDVEEIKPREESESLLVKINELKIKIPK